MSLIRLVPLCVLRAALGSSHLQVRTRFGTVVGQDATSPDPDYLQCTEFLGIPYAKPPVNFFRFRPPRRWTKRFSGGVLNATRYGNQCPQSSYAGGYFGDEDCLVLNIWRPRETTSTKLAVMLWIHGGAFVFGDDGNNFALNRYSGCSLASGHDVVVAGMNYRMGPLGFGTFEGFGGRIETNVGLADQREAMRWVRREIGQFGGDRERVTIFGQSAGAISVITHMASSFSRGLFHAAISQSGFPGTVSNEFGLNRTRDWADRIGCNRTWSRRWCLLTKTPQELILGAQEELNPLTSAGWSPTVDGCDIQAPPSLLFEENRTADVPFLAGFNTDEANVFVYPGFPSGMPASVPPLLLGAVFSKDEAYAMSPTQIGELLQAYSNYSDPLAQASEIVGDGTFICGSINTAIQQSRRAPTWLYRFNFRSSCPPTRPDTPGVYHGLDLPYHFNTPSAFGCAFDAAESALGERIQAAYANFAKYHNPNGPSGKGSLPQYWEPQWENVVFDDPNDTIDSMYKSAPCSLWAKLQKEIYSKDASVDQLASDTVSVTV